MTSSTAAASRSKTLDMAYIALFTVLIAVCAWISIPTLVPFTLKKGQAHAVVGADGQLPHTLSTADSRRLSRTASRSLIPSGMR